MMEKRNSTTEGQNVTVRNPPSVLEKGDYFE